MSVAFSIGVYLAAGIAVAIWLGAREGSTRQSTVLLATLIFWPAYLPVLLARPEEKSVEPSDRDPIFAALEQQIGRMPLDETRRIEHLASIARLEHAMASRKAVIGRLEAGKKRVAEIARLASSGELAHEEIARLDATQREIARDMLHVRESVVRLTLKLELLELRASKSPLEAQLAELKDELGRLAEARNEVEQIA